MVLVAMLLVPATDSAPAPAPVTVETLLLAKLLGLAGLKGYLIGRDLGRQ